MSQLAFDHLMNLSLAFHTKRKTGEVLRILDRGSAINHLFEVSLSTFFLRVLLISFQVLLFNIVPTFIDITIALGAFFYFFGYVLSIVVFMVMTLYGKRSCLHTF